MLECEGYKCRHFWHYRALNPPWQNFVEEYRGGAFSGSIEKKVAERAGWFLIGLIAD
jgi:hypothetical protein